VACARTRAPAPMRRCGWLSMGWRGAAALDAATSAVLVQALAVLLAHGTRGGRCQGARKATFRPASAPAHLSAARAGCHHPAASSRLMRLRLRLWVARTDAR
jgi:hypothetical protein